MYMYELLRIFGVKNDRAATASGSSTSLLVSVGFYSYPFLSRPLRTSLFLVL